MPQSSVSVVPIGKKICKPFLLEVMVFSPEAGFKFSVQVERACTPDADPIWKLVFDLFRVSGAKEVQIVHVSFTAGAPVEAKAVEQMITQGVSAAQAKVLVEEVHPATKALEGVKSPTAAQKKKIHTAMAKAVTAIDV